MAVSYIKDGVRYTTSGTAGNPQGSAPTGATDISYGAPATYNPQELAKVNTAISSATMANNTPIALPTQPTTPNYSSLVNSLAPNAVNGTITPVDTTPQTDFNTNLQKEMQRTQDFLGVPQSKEQIYSQAYNDSGIAQKQQAVNNYQGQLNSIVANSQAAQIATQGQGRGIPETILGGQQAQIAREAAIQSLPIAAQLSAAQGDLAQAQAHVDKLFAIRSADADAKYNYKTQVYNSVKEYTDKQQTIALNKAQVAEDRAYQTQRDNMSYARDLANTAFERGQSTLGSQIMGLDPTSKTYTQQLAVYAGKIAPDELKQLQIASARKVLAAGSNDVPTVKSINGVDMQWNPSANKWESISAGATDVSGNSESDALKVQLADLNSLITTGSYKKVVGTLPFGATPLLSAFTGEAQRAQGEIKQVISQNTLNTLINLKKQGGTLGALSDTERVMLQNAATKIGSWEKKNVFGSPTGNYNVSEKDFLKELNVIKDLTQKALKRADPLYNISEGDLNIINNLYGGMPSSTAPINPSNYY